MIAGDFSFVELLFAVPGEKLPEKVFAANESGLAVFRTSALTAKFLIKNMRSIRKKHISSQFGDASTDSN